MESQQPTADEQYPIVIAGGGVSGMYCALRLAQRETVSQIFLLEALPNHWGGRIETEHLDGFIAEFGPMRFEPKLQPTFDLLVKELGIGYKRFTGPTAGTVDFPAYDLNSEEKHLDGSPLNALELLRRGILLIMGRKLSADDPSGSGERHQQFLDDQTEESYALLRKVARLDNKYLWQMGFWNALSAPGILSHQALMKIRDTGTFYHMIPDNLNAVEWTIWWMRALKTAGRELAGLEGGSSQLTVALLERLHATGKVTLISGAKLTSFHEVQPGQITYTYLHQDKEKTGQARHLILAMPKSPLLKLSACLPKVIENDLESVNGFPMIKVFFTTSNPWWDARTRPQTIAHRMPTREMHYEFRAQDSHGMALIYTDRPSTEYWKHYVLGKVHERAEIYTGDENRDLKKQFARFLAAEAMEALTTRPDAVEEGGLVLTPAAKESLKRLNLEQIEEWIMHYMTAYAIRDWAREPYGAANHSWKPGVKSWEVQDRLKAFPASNGSTANVHICGEAYSDYSGFIEGALRSADLVLAAIS